eukprot:gene5043-7037_t
MNSSPAIGVTRSTSNDHNHIQGEIEFEQENQDLIRQIRSIVNTRNVSILGILSSFFSVAIIFIYIEYGYQQPEHILLNSMKNNDILKSNVSEISKAYVSKISVHGEIFNDLNGTKDAISKTIRTAIEPIIANYEQDKQDLLLKISKLEEIYQNSVKYVSLVYNHSVDTRLSIDNIQKKYDELKSKLAYVQREQLKLNISSSALAINNRINLIETNLLAFQESFVSQISTLSSLSVIPSQSHTNSLHETTQTQLASYLKELIVKFSDFKLYKNNLVNMKSQLVNVKQYSKQLSHTNGQFKNKIQELYDSLHNVRNEISDTTENLSQCMNDKENFIPIINTILLDKLNGFVDEVKSVMEAECTSKLENEKEKLLKYMEQTVSKKSDTNIPSRDYALSSAGGQIVHNMTSATYFPPTKRIDETIKSFFKESGLPELNNYIPSIRGDKILNTLGIHIGVGTPEDAISLDTSLGSCWPVEGSSGILTVEIAFPILFKSMSIDHISSDEAININTAPKDFKLFGFTSFVSPPKLLVSGSYELNSHPVQNFPLNYTANANNTYKFFKLEIQSNHGNNDYTCLYRLRIHGQQQMKYPQQNFSSKLEKFEIDVNIAKFLNTKI